MYLWYDYIMETTTENYYKKILREELVPSMGCTEPVAIALACARCKEILDEQPTKILVECSGNIIKNVNSVAIPNTNHKGIIVAALYGAFFGVSSDELEIFKRKHQDLPNQIEKLVKQNICTFTKLETFESLHLVVSMSGEHHYAKCIIKNLHNRFVYLEKDGQVLLDDQDQPIKQVQCDRKCLNMKDIYEFAKLSDLSDVADLFENIIVHNQAISIEAMKGHYGLDIGHALLKMSDKPSVWDEAIAYSSAASEARMCGCAMPVITNSGSGNQGIASTVPLLIFANHLNVSKECLMRSLCFSALCTIHQKTPIGRLSAFCGVICASCAAGCGIAFMQGYDLECINRMVQSTLANVSGIICDGAKASCAAKISSCLRAVQLAYTLTLQHKCYESGDGIIQDDVEKTIASVGSLASKGMKETEDVIFDIMIHC